MRVRARRGGGIRLCSSSRCRIARTLNSPHSCWQLAQSAAHSPFAVWREGKGGRRGRERGSACAWVRASARGGGVRLCISSNSHVEFLVMAVSWCVVVRSFQPRPATSTTPRPANPRLVRLGARISPAKTRARQGVPGGVVCPTRRNFCGRCRPCRGPPWLARPATLPTLPAPRPAVPPRPPRPAAPTTPRPADLRLGQRACLLGLATIYF